MKKLWMVGALVLTVAVLFALTPNTMAGAATSDFKIEGNTLIRYTGTASTVSVPSTVETIGRSAFENNNIIKKVSIPDSVTKIEEYAFWGCENLETVVLGEGLKEVSDFAFTDCEKLNKVTIPDNINRIGIMAFADCTSLQDITIPVSVTDIHETAFDGVPNLQIHAEEYSYPYRYAIERGEELANAPVSPLATEVPDETEIPLPTSTPVPTPEPTNRPIGDVVGSATVVGNSAVVLVNNRDLDAQDGADVDIEAYKEQAVVESQVLDWSYYGDKTLLYMDLPKGTTEIGSFGFARSCLKSITLPEGLTKIDYAAFYHCDSLENVTIPKTVTQIEAKAFTFTPWMQNFLTGNADSSENSDFLIVGDGVLLAYRGNATTVVIPEGVKYIAAEAFLNHTEIEKVQFSTTIISVDSTAFEGCTYKPAF